ncbi:MAG: hypothetical protein EX266_04635 [Rhodobacteraceae bacterium]|nr:MAG: hypothetical protein EX266_04635 [Paracoccaceae bacterium]
MRRVLAVLTTMIVMTGASEASQIERACLKSERAYGKRQLCRCIQSAADLTLTAKDQKLAASFFSDPHRAQEIRQSNSRRHERFWDRYESFGRTAETFCRG